MGGCVGLVGRGRTRRVGRSLMCAAQTSLIGGYCEVGQQLRRDNHCAVATAPAQWHVAGRPIVESEPCDLGMRRTGIEASGPEWSGGRWWC